MKEAIIITSALVMYVWLGVAIAAFCGIVPETTTTCITEEICL